MDMPSEGQSVKASLRGTLAESNVSAVAIAVLLFWSLHWGILALKGPVFSALDWIVTAIAIGGIPFRDHGFTFSDRIFLATTFAYLFYSLLSFTAAWLLSRWIFGAGPFRSLAKYRPRVARRINV
jgi:hypothetical protein